MTDTQLREILQHLKQKGYTVVYAKNRNGTYIDISINICGNALRLRCKFLPSFPYSFPKMYILQEFYKDIEPLPHIDNEGYICTFDSNMAFPNYNEPTKLVEESIEKAKNILEDGIKGANKDDFVKEFISYWGLDSYQTIFALLSPDDKPRLLNCCKDAEGNYYATEDILQLNEYLIASKGSGIDKSKTEKMLYLPLKNKWYPPYPKTNKEMFLKIKEEEVFRYYYKYLENRTKRSIIIFSQEIEGEKYLAGWFHKPVDSLNGFRSGKINPLLAYTGHNRNSNIIKLSVEQLERERLFNRGGDGKIVENYKVSISGCGSIGSILAEILTELGINQFTLIDNEILKSDNIARHTCGASYIGKPKTDAIKRKMISHFPYIKCEPIAKDVFDVLEENINLFNATDVNFIVVGNKPIEARFMELFNSGEILKPIVIIWVEPFLLGGHAVIVQKQQDIRSTIYDLEYKFRKAVVSNGEQYTKKEAGCQSTFIPYSAFEAKQFVYSFMDYFLENHIRRKIEGNYLFSWCGNLRWARKEHIMISDFWISKRNRNISVERLDTDANLQSE